MLRDPESISLTLSVNKLSVTSEQVAEEYVILLKNHLEEEEEKIKLQQKQASNGW